VLASPRSEKSRSRRPMQLAPTRGAGPSSRTCNTPPAVATLDTNSEELARHVMVERGLNTADTALLQLSRGAPVRCSAGSASVASCARSKTRSMAGSICGRSRYSPFLPGGRLALIAI
jgi:hypothetical protein